MPKLPNRFPDHLLLEVVYEPVSLQRGGSTHSALNTGGLSPNELERKGRIESIAREYLEGKMPRTSSTSSRPQRPPPPRTRNSKGLLKGTESDVELAALHVSYEPVRGIRRSAASAGLSNRRDEDDGTAAKRPRIERIAKQYNEGKMPVIQSASLKGPLKKGWKSPWTKPPIRHNSKTAAAHRPHTPEYDIVVVSTPNLSSQGIPSRNEARSHMISPPSEQGHLRESHSTQTSGDTISNRPSQNEPSITHHKTLAQGQKGPLPKEPSHVEVVTIQTSEEPGIANGQAQHDEPAAAAAQSKSSTGGKVINNKPFSTKANLRSTASGDVDSPFPFKYQKDIPKNRDVGQSKVMENVILATSDTRGRKHAPRRVNLYSPQDIADTNKPEHHPRRKRPSDVASRLERPTIVLPRSEVFEETGTAEPNFETTLDEPIAISTNESVIIVSKPAVTRERTSRSSPHQEFSVTVTSPTATEKSPTRSTKKRKEGFHVEIAEPSSEESVELKTRAQRQAKKPARLISSASLSDRMVTEQVTVLHNDDALDVLPRGEHGRKAAGIVQDIEQETIVRHVPCITIDPEPMDESSAFKEPVAEPLDDVAAATVNELRNELDPEARPSRTSRRAQKITSLDTPSYHQYISKTVYTGVDSATQQVSGSEFLPSHSAMLDSPDVSTIHSKKKSKKKSPARTREISTSRQPTKVQDLSRNPLLDDANYMLDHITVAPQTTTAKTVPRQEAKDIEANFTSQQKADIEVLPSARMDAKPLLAEDNMYASVAQNQTEDRSRTKKSLHSILHVAEIPIAGSRKKRREQNRVEPVSILITRDGVLAGAEDDDTGLSQENTHEQQVLNESQTPRSKRSEAAQDNLADVLRTRSQTSNKQTRVSTLKHVLSPQDRKEYQQVIDFVDRAAEDAQSESEADSNAAHQFQGSPIIPFSDFKKKIANQAIETAMRFEQPMSTQQLFEAQSPIGWSTEKKDKKQARFGPSYHDETQYEDTQALFDAAEGLNSPAGSALGVPSDNDEECTPVKAKPRRRSSGRRREVPHYSHHSRSSRQDVSGIDRVPLQEKPSSSSLNMASGSCRKSSRLQEINEPSYQHEQQLSHLSQESEVDISWMDSILSLSPLRSRAQA